MNKPYKVPKCGAMDSKYFSHPEQFDKDIEQNKFSKELFKIRVKALITEEPAKIDIRYHQAIEAIKEIKEEFGL